MLNSTADSAVSSSHTLAALSALHRLGTGALTMVCGSDPVSQEKSAGAFLVEEIMKRISVLACILGVCFASAAWGQQPNAPAKIHPWRHHAADQRLPSGGVSHPYLVQSDKSQDKVWELKTYPGGTWTTMGDVNDFGVAVGQGDLPDGSTHNLVVPLFGNHAGGWIDLGTLGGTESGWEEGIITVSNTGMIVGHSASTDQNRPHGFVWTEKSGMADLGTLADIGNTAYSSSYAGGINRMGTLIVGWSGIEDSCLGCAPTLPVVWTPSVAWKDRRIVTTWTIHQLDTTGFEAITNWYAWNVNDFGQIVGEGDGDNGAFVGVIWTPLKNGTWKINKLPAVAGYPNSEPFNINDRGEISGDIEPADFSVWIPSFWKPLDLLRKTYSNPIVLPVPEGGFTNCYTDGINELGDLTGECWGEDVDQAVRWTTKDKQFTQVLGFPGDWSWSFRVNNNRIAVVTYGGGDKCSTSDYISCGGAIHFH